jgi:hypothetical protein
MLNSHPAHAAKKLCCLVTASEQILTAHLILYWEPGKHRNMMHSASHGDARLCSARREAWRRHHHCTTERRRHHHCTTEWRSMPVHSHAIIQPSPSACAAVQPGTQDLSAPPEAHASVTVTMLAKPSSQYCCHHGQIGQALPCLLQVLSARAAAAAAQGVTHPCKPWDSWCRLHAPAHRSLPLQVPRLPTSTLRRYPP